MCLAVTRHCGKRISAGKILTLVLRQPHAGHCIKSKLAISESQTKDNRRTRGSGCRKHSNRSFFLPRAARAVRTGFKAERSRFSFSSTDDHRHSNSFELFTVQHHEAVLIYICPSLFITGSSPGYIHPYIPRRGDSILGCCN